MTIDLGDELADYDGRKPVAKPYSIESLFAESNRHWDRTPTPTGSITPLADLEAEGFNTTPPWPGFDPHAVRTTLIKLHDTMLTWPTPGFDDEGTFRE